MSSTRSVLLILMLASLFSIVSLTDLRPVAATCGDISQTIDQPIQQWSPITIQLQFPFTKNRNAAWVPVGFATGASVEFGTDHITFKANENDTYMVWMLAQYDQPVTTNVTLTMQEGDRSPVHTLIPLCGTSIYLRWNAIQLIPEPHGVTKEEATQIFFGQFQSFFAGNNANLANLGTGQSILEGEFLALIVEQVVIIGLLVRRKRKGLQG